MQTCSSRVNFKSQPNPSKGPDRDLISLNKVTEMFDFYRAFSTLELDKQDVALLVLAAMVFYWTWNLLKGWNVRLPPGPPSFPVIGNMHQLSRHLYRDWERLGKKHGPLMYLRIGSIPVIVAQNATYAREFTKCHDQEFAYRPQDMLCNKIGMFDCKNMGASQVNENWRFQRKVLATELFIPRRLRVFKEDRQRILLGTVREMLEESDQGRPVRMKDHLISLMYNIITQMVAGKVMYGTSSAVSDEQREFRSIISNYIRVLPRFAVKDWFPCTRGFGDFQGIESEMKSAASSLDNYLQDWLDDRRKLEQRRKELSIHRNGQEEEEESDGDFLDALLRMHGVDDEPLTDETRRLILQPILIGGTESAASVIEWALAELCKSPELMKRLQAEIDSVVGRDRPVQEEDLPSMKLMLAVIKETFRLHPITAYLLPRQGITPCKVLGGYDIPSNARVFISLWALGRDESAWENPLEFRPDRFLDRDPSQPPIEFNGSNHEFMPFGSGRRLCPGISLGALMVQLGLANLLHLCNFSLPRGLHPEDIDLSEEPGMNLAMKTPLEVFVSRKLDPEFYAA